MALSLRRVAAEQVDALYKEKKYRGPIFMMIFSEWVSLILYYYFY
jgi:CPA2 family monovalent cation:H+ antiporter-2